jgi:hypothetical protein
VAAEFDQQDQVARLEVETDETGRGGIAHAAL